MGCSVSAHCECGYSLSNFLTGGGMMNFMSYCAFPVYCHQCQDLTSANLLDSNPCCKKCGSPRVVPYDSPQLKLQDGEKIVDSWNIEDELGRELVLTDGNYFCPKCRQFTLKFEEGGIMWD